MPLRIAGAFNPNWFFSPSVPVSVQASESPPFRAGFEFCAIWYPLSIIVDAAKSVQGNQSLRCENRARHPPVGLEGTISVTNRCSQVVFYSNVW